MPKTIDSLGLSGAFLGSNTCSMRLAVPWPPSAAHNFDVLPNLRKEGALHLVLPINPNSPDQPSGQQYLTLSLVQQQHQLRRLKRLSKVPPSRQKNPESRPPGIYNLPDGAVYLDVTPDKTNKEWSAAVDGEAGFSFPQDDILAHSQTDVAGSRS